MDGDRMRFLQAFNRLAVACRLPAGEVDAAMKQVYYDTLADFPIEAIEQAAGELAKSSQWFPKAAEWRSVAGNARVTGLLKALPPAREEPWQHECEACEDTGWEQRACYGGTRNTCGRKKCERDGAADHRYMVACPCRDTNRTYQRHHRVPKGREVYTV